MSNTQSTTQSTTQSNTLTVPAEYLEQMQAFLQTLQQRNEEKKQFESKVREIKEELDSKESDSDEEPDKQPFVEVDCVSDHRVDENGKWQFYILWKGFEGAGEWVNDDDTNCETLISEYLTTAGLNTVYCFCRVSSKKQSGENHVSLDVQSESLVRFAREKYGDFARIKVIRLVASAHRSVPRVFQEIAEVARAGDVVLAFRIDRLSRNIIHSAKLLDDMNKRGVSIYACDQGMWYHDPNSVNRRMNPMFLQAVLDAHKESMGIGDRVRASVAFRRARGDHIGGCAFGWMHVRDENGVVKLEENKEEQELIEDIRKSRASPASIARLLNRQGRLKRGRKWTAQMVSRYNDEALKWKAERAEHLKKLQQERESECYETDEE